MIGWTCQGTLQCCPCLKVMRAKSSTLARRLLGVRGLRHVPPQRTATGQTFETARAPSQQPSSSSLRSLAFHHRGIIQTPPLHLASREAVHDWESAEHQRHPQLGLCRTSTTTRQRASRISQLPSTRLPSSSSPDHVPAPPLSALAARPFMNLAPQPSLDGSVSPPRPLL